MIDIRKKEREWNDKSKYNSFNSYKGLVYYHTHYKPIAAWLKGLPGVILPPPIELSLDPAHICNYKCEHCNAQRYLTINPDEVPRDMKLMTEEHLKKIIDFASKWGVKGVCLGGGGEPLMNKNVWKLPEYIRSKEMQCSFATNGSIINEEIADQMMHCRWVGISVDAGTKETFDKVHGFGENDITFEKVKECYERVHGISDDNEIVFSKIRDLFKKEMGNLNGNGQTFEKVINNLKLLVKKKRETGSKIDIAFKFLIRPDNWQDIYEACRLAKEIGVRDFHARPADLERKDFKSAMELNYNIEKIHELFEKCHELGDGENFRVFTIMHKYNPDFRVMHTFKNCVCAPLMLQVCADGHVYVCADHRIEPRFRLASHFPNPEGILNLWGSDRHRELLKGINVNGECGRCTYGEYARQIEELAIGTLDEDPMCVDFP